MVAKLYLYYVFSMICVSEIAEKWISFDFHNACHIPIQWEILRWQYGGYHVRQSITCTDTCNLYFDSVLRIVFYIILSTLNFMLACLLCDCKYAQIVSLLSTIHSHIPMYLEVLWSQDCELQKNSYVTVTSYITYLYMYLLCAKHWTRTGSVSWAGMM
jgi:hypothetical protein